MHIPKRGIITVGSLQLGKGGIPSVFIGEGLKFKDMMKRGEAQERDYLEHRYHQPTMILPGNGFYWRCQDGDVRL